MSKTLSSTEAKYLIGLCKIGKLFEVQNWIVSGKSLCVPAELKVTPLETSVNTGFHSLVELVARNELSHDVKNRALWRALTHKRLDLIELLVSQGAEISSVPFIEVLLIWDPTIIRFFLAHGADVITDSPFAVAFGEKIRTALRPWMECKEKYPDVASLLQEQADRALRHFCYKRDLKWVSLLMWAGADPRSSGPTLDDDLDLDESEHTSALAAAACCENVQILKRLKPDVKRDDVDKLLSDAARYGHHDVVRYLLELGAKPNDKANGGSTALHECLSTSFWCESSRSRYSSTWYSAYKPSKYSVSKTLETIQLLLEQGALWRPDNAREVTSVRRSLFECDSDVTLELVEQLIKHTACTQDTIHDLLRTPAMKEHLIQVVKKFVGMGFDVRTATQKVEDKQQREMHRQWAVRQLASRYNREEIYRDIWSEPIQHVAKRYKLSDVGLAKVCRKLNIPRPGRGYWAKKAAGKVIPKTPPLLELSF